MTRITRRAALTAAAASALAAPSIARAQTPMQWRMVTSWPRNLPGPGVSAQRLADRITTMSHGRIEIKLYAADEIVPAFGVMDAVGSDTAQIGHTAAVFWMGKIKASAFFLAMPYGLTPLEHNSWIEQGGGQELWDALYADLGVKPFMAGNTGMSMGGWFKDELRSKADLNGLKFRMPGLGGEMYAGMGIVQVSIPPGQILPELQKGTIDAAEFAGPSSDLALALFRAAPYYYWPGLHEPNGTGECLINRPVWEGLDSTLKTVIVNACAAENAAALAEAEMRNAEALRVLVEDHSVQLRQFPSDIEEAARPVARDVLAQFKSRGGLDAQIHDSYVAMLERERRWSNVSVRAFLDARDRG
ncbi:MAG: TRAP transporter substrate-binding protein [Pseudomonadota bacterium]